MRLLYYTWRVMGFVLPRLHTHRVTDTVFAFTLRPDAEGLITDPWGQFVTFLSRIYEEVKTK